MQKIRYNKRKKASKRLQIVQECLTESEQDAQIVYVDYNPCAVGQGYLGHRSKKPESYSLKEAEALGLNKYEWDGK